MRKYVLIFCLIIFAILFFIIMFFGIKLGSFEIKSYKEVQKVATEEKAISSELNQKNNVEFEEKNEALVQAVSDYNNTKNRYDELLKEGKITSNDLYNSIDLYDVDFLWATIGNYATQKGVTLQLDVTKSATKTAVSSEYVMCDLKFTVTGEYIAITDFIYSLEDDDTLGFEISEFLLEKGGENLQATFIVKEVPINNKNLSSVPNATTSVTQDTSNASN